MLVPFGIVIVREKDPFLVGVTTSSLSSVETITVDPVKVVPRIVISFLSNTSSSCGESIVRKLLLSGVGVAIVCCLFLVLRDKSAGIVLVS